MNLKFCRQCKKCCVRSGIPNVYMIPKEIERIRLTGFKFKMKAFHGNLMKLTLRKEKCPFLENEGCKLKSLKPLDCKMFPLTFRQIDSKIFIYLHHDCPYIKKLSKSWINKTKKEIIRELSEWTIEERKDFNSIGNWEKLEKLSEVKLSK